ncbi:BirA family transcriptional regulator, biotin operon repressor / biotin-[acetyl-CoA-carboxylase] ligase [Granulicella rosea]|uniref:BirA family transcriptional regulator, biotin operon repressor / biotin-[acetyl-CoA-carboxylase] ligase n=1 Tax=Granulicella rosea TaxID=474952 RepID=A0A239KV93_9BACT|nr:biotin--[acetyl-CoA-carboxylase] ligase [Granulicella rosea]SNT21134.1 BirA family transcriptional regulator, biotin operon repressor / biotin-[acetyl-CoA-carboxylase] ligase [Granulicella rosea]
MPASPLDLGRLHQRLIGTRFAGHIQHFDSVGSTNQLALEAAQSGATAGVWVADEQTAGRGRGGHGWHSAAGDGLYVSVLVTPQLPLERGLWLSLATGLAAQAAIAEASGLRADIRWPNDLLIGAKKCGGILVESSALPARAGETAMLRYAVIGVGININHAEFPADLAELATSLRIVAGHPVSREELLSALLRALDAEITSLEMAHSTLLARFAHASTWVNGMRVQVPEQGGYTGETCGLDARGFLQVRDDAGTVRTVLSGGVRPE